MRDTAADHGCSPTESAVSALPLGVLFKFASAAAASAAATLSLRRTQLACITSERPTGYASQNTAAAVSKTTSKPTFGSSSSYARSSMTKSYAPPLATSSRAAASAVATRSSVSPDRSRSSTSPDRSRSTVSPDRSSSSTSPGRSRRQMAPHGALDTVLESRVLGTGRESPAVYRGRFSFKLQTAPADMSVAAELAAAAAAASQQLRKDVSGGYTPRSGVQGSRAVASTAAARPPSNSRGRALSSSSDRESGREYAAGLSTLKRVCQTQGSPVPSLSEQLERASRRLAALASAKSSRASAGRESQPDRAPVGRDRSHLSLTRSHVGPSAASGYSSVTPGVGSSPSTALRSTSAERARRSYARVVETSPDRSRLSAYSRRSVDAGRRESSSRDGESYGDVTAWKLQAAAEAARLQYMNNRSRSSNRRSSRY